MTIVFGTLLVWLWISFGVLHVTITRAMYDEGTWSGRTAIAIGALGALLAPLSLTILAFASLLPRSVRQRWAL